jgi:DNA-binding transcriptional LysR family regulator
MLMVAGSDTLVECPRRLANKYARKLGLQVLDPPYPPFRFTIQAVRRMVEDPGVDWLVDRVRAALT